MTDTERMIHMAVIKQERVSKKTGKTKKIYMASQWHPLLKKRVYGPSRQNKKDAKQDDAKLTLQIKKEVKEEKVKKQSEEFFGKVADTWLEANKKTYADQTYRTYRGYLDRYIFPVFEDVPISAIEPKHILNFKKSYQFKEVIFMVKIRLQRQGKKKAPFYHIVVADSRSPKDGKIIEQIGTYDPMTEPSTIVLNKEKLEQWMKNGAQPTETVKALIKNA